MQEFSLLTAVIFFVVTFVVHFLGASTGGSAMLTTPMCIFFGMPANAAVATTRIGGLFSTLSGIACFSKYKKINYRISLIGGVIASVGAFFGAHALSNIPDDLAQKTIGMLMISILLCSLCNRRFHFAAVKDNGKHIFGYSMFFVIGFLGGAFGGQGIMLFYSLLLLFGLDTNEAAGTRTIISLIITIISLITFYKGGYINWSYGFILAASSCLGSYIGAYYSINKDAGGKINKVFELVLIFMAARLIIC